MTRTPLLVLALLLAPLPCAQAQPGSIVEALGGEGHAGDAESSDAAALTARRYDALVAAGDRAALKAFLVAMPKGADLHNHYSGSLHAETYLELARAKQDRFRIDADTLAFVRRGYAPPFWPDRPLHTVDDVLADPDLHERVLRAWSIRGYGEEPEQVSPDQDFFQAFLGFGAFAKETLPEGLRILKRRALDENVLYLETMLMPGGYWYTSQEDDDRLRAAATLEELEQELQRLAAQFEADPAFRRAVTGYVRAVRRNHEGIDADAFRMRYVTYADRNGAPANAFGRLLSSFAAAAREPLIVGVNLVGAENGAVALRDYRLHMRMVRFLRDRFPRVPVALHAGELVPGMGQPEDLGFHVREAVEVAGARRVGHAIDATHDPDVAGLLRLLQDRGVAVEINLTSNDFILGVKGQDHPFELFRTHGVPMVISTDDAGVARTDGLSHEYLLLSERHGVSYPELKRLAHASIEHSFLPAATRSALRGRLAEQFEAFERGAAAAAASSGD